MARFNPELGSGQRVGEIQAENARLRQLVTNLLLEKVKLEEMARSNSRAETEGNARLDSLS
jgi:hypothetical protein